MNIGAETTEPTGVGPITLKRQARFDCLTRMPESQYDLLCCNPARSRLDIISQSYRNLEMNMLMYEEDAAFYGQLRIFLNNYYAISRIFDSRSGNPP